MGTCRCEDLKKMLSDFQTLSTLKDQAAELVEYDNTVQESLVGIANVINDTVITPEDDNLHIQFRQLNNESCAAIESMVSKIRIKHSELMGEFTKAAAEDLWWHYTHPLETIQSWLDN